LAWEFRYGRRVYIRSVRSGAKVRHQYFGFGPGAVAAAAADDRRRAERGAARAVRQRQRSAWTEAWRPLQDLAAKTTVLMNAVLVADGFHRHGGVWRKRRRPMPTRTDMPTQTSGRDDLIDRLRGLSDRAQQGDAEAAAELGCLLDANPDVWHKLGDLATAVRYAWAKRATAGDLLRSECLLRRVEAIEAKLSRPEPSQLERLLVKRVGAAYLSLQVAEIEAAAAANAAGKETVLTRRDTLARLLATERMFQSAAKALALYQTMTRRRPSPADMLKPVDEQAPTGQRTGLESGRRIIGSPAGPKGENDRHARSGEPVWHGGRDVPSQSVTTRK
jgi:hypothetical protein